MKMAEEAAAYVTAKFERPIKLEFEKVYFPYLLINKKRYAGLYWTNPHTWDKMDAKGIVTVRRDNCPLVVTLINTCLHKLLIERNVDGAVEFAKKVRNGKAVWEENDENTKEQRSTISPLLNGAWTSCLMLS